MPVEGSYGRGGKSGPAISGSNWHFPLAFAKKQVGGLAAVLPRIQRAHGLREVQREAQNHAGQAVYNEERGDAHGFGQHATDGDAYWCGQPHGCLLCTSLKAKREERGLSQGEVSKAIFVSRQTISSWENDKTYPDVQSLLLLSQLFEVSVDELVRGDVVAMQQAIAEDSRILLAGLLLALEG